MNPTAPTRIPSSSLSLLPYTTSHLSASKSLPTLSPNMSKIRGFNLRKGLIRVSKWVFRKIRLRSRPGYHRLGNSPRSSIAKLLSWGRKLTASAKSCLPVSVGSGYAQLGSGSVVGSDRDPSVPKGHLAVYVGQKDGELHRVLLPVIYFNHPLFGELLKEAEEEFGFHHDGGITIPCRFTEFERVKTRIASGSRRSTRPKRLA
ncbi:auxin-responsive protein SAUR36-like [Vigna radiata var. radiata]|uniref:Auxin-responsive protein SAUR36-like n=1 Tax=Vigna radiata var. radiata TaxID=3916 RepID=A0A1S3TFJ1_VIGRR|nr:auxin-responsive protein SAUR36-like [Vigna radiata var. radiata]